MQTLHKQHQKAPEGKNRRAGKRPQVRDEEEAFADRIADRIVAKVLEKIEAGKGSTAAANITQRLRR